MAILMIPLILMIVGIGGVLMIVGRKLPDIRMARDTEKTRDVTVALEPSDAPFAPRQATLTPPRRARIVSRAARVVGRRFVGLVRLGGRGVVRARTGTALIFRVFLRVFQRRPAVERIPRLATRANTVLKNAVEARRVVVPTTLDIQPTTANRPDGASLSDEGRHPLRIPEPLHAERFQREPSQEETPRSANRPAGASLASAESPALDTSSVMSPVDSLPQEKENTPQVQEERSHLVERAAAPVAKHRPPHLRRVVGHIRPRPLQVHMAASAATTHPENADLPVPPVVLSDQGVTGEALATPPEDAGTITALIENGKFGRAESLLIDLLSKNPRDTNAYRMLGIVYMKREEFLQAREVFEETLRRDPEQLAIYGLLGLTYFSLGEYGKALTVYQRAHDGDEANIEYLEKLLIISSRMDRRPLMRVTAQKILALDPDHQQAKSILERAIAQ